MTEPEPDASTASVYIQWKGTDVCLDFYCACGANGGGHFDGYFAYGLRCSNCGRVWEMPTTLQLKPGAPENDLVQETDMPHYDDPTAPADVPRLATFDDD